MTPRDAVVRSLVQFEGVESNDPNDHGGHTRYGLTFATYLQLVTDGTDATFRALTREAVIDLLTEHFALRPGYARIADPWVRWAVIDFSINSGQRTATKALQRAAGLTGAAVDGMLGRDTEMAVAAMDQGRLFRRLMAQRIRHYGQIIRRDHSQATFAGGWFNRAADILEAA